MESMLDLFGMDHVPEGVPKTLVMAIAMNGYSEREARAIMKDGGNAAEADEWIEKLRNAGCFGGLARAAPDNATISLSAPLKDGDIEDAGERLWRKLFESLQRDENGFKHQVMVLDNCIKNTGGTGEVGLQDLKRRKAGQEIPFAAVQDKCPWNGCKFAGNSVMHFISGTSAPEKRDACRSASRSLGGCTLPPSLEDVRWPYALSEAYNEAASSVEKHSTALFVHVMDVEVMRNPSKNGGFFPVQRPGTFAHVFVMTISKAGVYLYQAYGPRGYTLLQYMQEHEDDFPMSLVEGKAWAEKLEVFAADPIGIWSEEANEAYAFCFGVDLIKLGCMSVGSQMDVYVQVEEHIFNWKTVENNFSLLPQPDFPSYPKCRDGTMARSKKPPPGYAPDGGVPHSYVPLVTKCWRCGKGAPRMKRHPSCSKCKKACYCSKECQVDDWKLRHKKVCANLRTFSMMLG